MYLCMYPFFTEPVDAVVHSGNKLLTNTYLLRKGGGGGHTVFTPSNNCGVLPHPPDISMHAPRQLAKEPRKI